MCSSSSLIPDPDQVIEVPKIVPEDVSEPQLVEQLVEVPTVVSWSMLQQIMEQNVDIPAVGGSGAGGGLSGFLPGQNYSMTAEQIGDNPVPRPGGAGDLQGLPSGQGSTASIKPHIARRSDDFRLFCSHRTGIRGG